MHSRLGVWGHLTTQNIRKALVCPLEETFRVIVGELRVACCGVLRYDGIGYSLTLEVAGRAGLITKDVSLDVFQPELRMGLRLALIEALDISEALRDRVAPF